MEVLFAKLVACLSERPFLGYFFAALLFLLSVIYTKLETRTFVVEGHTFALTAVSGITIDGKLYYIPVYKEVTR